MENTTSVVIRFRTMPWMLLRGYWAINTRVISVLGVFLVLYTAWTVLSSIGKPGFAVMCAFYAMLWTLFAISFGLLPWIRFRGFVREPNFAGECELTASEDSLRGRNGQVESRFEWSSFTRFVEMKSLLILRMGRKHMIVIPKAAFANDDDLELFRNLARRKTCV